MFRNLPYILQACLYGLTSNCNNIVLNAHACHLMVFYPALQPRLAVRRSQMDFNTKPGFAIFHSPHAKPLSKIRRVMPRNEQGNCRDSGLQSTCEVLTAGSSTTRCVGTTMAGLPRRWSRRPLSHRGARGGSQMVLIQTSYSDRQAWSKPRILMASYYDFNIKLSFNRSYKEISD